MSPSQSRSEDEPVVCSVCGKDWMSGHNHSIWCGGFGSPHGKPVRQSEREALLRDAGLDPKRGRVFESAEGYVEPLEREVVEHWTTRLAKEAGHD